MQNKLENVCNYILSKMPKNRKTQLFLNKYLFFTYGYYYSATGNEPFPANFHAWTYGPVEMNIYHDFLLEQNKKYNINILSDIDLELVDDIVDYLNKLNENLVDKSHKCECWKNNLNHKIPRNEIKSCFDANNQFKIEGSGLTGDEYLNKIKSILN